MPRKLPRNFFTQRGHILNPQGETVPATTGIPREAISSLSNVKPGKRDLIWLRHTLLERSQSLFGSRAIFLSQARWVFSVPIAALLISTWLFGTPLYKHTPNVPDKYSLFSSIPLTLDSVSQELDYSDSRSVRIDKVLAAFNCPMEGLGETFVKEADENNIPYWVTAAIAFQESSCGKNTPSIDGVKTKNAWGWATYGENVYEFDSFEQGIQVVSKYMSKKFYSRGVTDLCEIMRTYTPPSNGSWCRGVQYFGDFIQNYKSPASS